MSAELILAVVAGADLCLQYGQKLIRAYKDFQNATNIVSEKILIVESIWSRTSMQIEFVKRVVRTMGEEHCAIYLDVFAVLQGKQEKSIVKIESFIKSPSNGGGTIRKWRVAMHRSSLDSTIQDLRDWQRIFDPTRFIGFGFVRRILYFEQNPRLSGDSAKSFGFQFRLEDPRIFTRRWTGLGSNRDCPILKYQARPSSQFAQAVRTDAEALARKLSKVDSDAFGLLAAYGLVKRKATGTARIQSFNLVFSMPTDAFGPRSLRQDLMRPQTFSLSKIVHLARRLAQATSFIHTCDFVHKNIRPEMIIAFGDMSSNEQDAGKTYLLGFDSFRNVNFHTLRKGDAAWERDLYRHPSRQGLHAHDKYVMQHDVYSLGVCLLEIGLWTSFVEYEDIEEATGNTQPKPSPSAALGLEVGDFEPKVVEATNSYDHIKDHLVTLARSRLPPRMGDKYTSVVITCLTCLDEGNEDFGDDQEMQDEDGILVGVRFIEKVLFRLSEISF
ncbi:hypothetical protein G7054_g11018 [Neopestalotiopsis clavispora]|nr:hypothetical protein G7054_g11018 [Neopestalotiopsis clavispora]